MKCVAVTRFSAMLMLALTLPGCQKADQSAPAPQESEQAGPEAKPGLSASDGVLVLPAVKGRPGAAYFMLTNMSEKTAEVAAVHIDGAASAEMHETKGGTMKKLDSLTLAPGTIVKFERGGKHVMAFGLSDDLKPGGATEMTLSFADGDKLSTPLMIEAMGAGEGMDAMDHGEGH